MQSGDLKLPSNKKFGYFFSLVFLFASALSLYLEKFGFSIIFLSLCTILILVTILAADILSPFNKLWMQLGLLLGKIVNPILLGMIFFGLITPVSIILRLLGRDEMRIRNPKKSTYWVEQNPKTKSSSFKNQF